MMKKAVVLCLTLMIGLGLAAGKSSAAQMMEDLMEKLDMGYEEGAVIGLGVRYGSRPYDDVDDHVFPVPIVSVQYKRFFIEGSTFGVILHENEQLKFSLLGAPRFWGYEPDDSSALVGMTKRKWTVEGGVRAEWENQLFTTELTFLNDLTGEHEGQEVGLFVKREFLDGGLTPRVGFKWMSDDLVDHYFGVNAGEARAGRPAYDVDGGVNFVAGATLALPIGEKWAWVTDATVEVLNDDIQDSPIVEDDTICSFVTGLVYRY